MKTITEQDKPSRVREESRYVWVILDPTDRNFYELLTRPPFEREEQCYSPYQYEL